MSLSWQRRWLPLLIPVVLLLIWLALALLPHLAEGAPLENYAPRRLLIQSEEQKQLIDQEGPDLRIIDFRHQAQYFPGHIPGAIQVWRPETEDRRQRGPGVPASAPQIENLLARRSVADRDNPVAHGF